MFSVGAHYQRLPGPGGRRDHAFRHEGLSKFVVKSTVFEFTDLVIAPAKTGNHGLLHVSTYLIYLG